MKWKVKDGKLDIDFMAPTKDMIGRLSCDSFSMVNEGEMAIFNTTSKATCKKAVYWLQQFLKRDSVHTYSKHKVEYLVWQLCNFFGLEG